MRRFFAAIALVAAFIVPAAAQAAPTPGSLIKLVDDHNPATTADSAVYYFGGDGKRYVFPNQGVYKTWYADFSGIASVTAAEMAAVPIGGNIRYRPGTRLVKIISVPKVYAVEPGGVLRWITSEEAAKALYGNDWAKRVSDVPDTQFIDYVEGAPLASAVYPAGAVVRRAGDGVLFRIEGMIKRRLTAEAKSALRIRDEFALSAADLSAYADGPDLTAADTGIADVSEKNAPSSVTPPTLSLQTPATHALLGNDNVLGELHVVSGKPVVIRKVAVKIQATTGAVSAGTSDIDAGGLVFNNTARANMTRIRFVDAAGAEPLGRGQLEAVIEKDQEQTITFVGNVNVPANTDAVLYFKAEIYGDVPPDEGYAITVVRSGVEVIDAGTGKPADFFPAADLAGPTISTVKSAFEVSGGGTPGNVVYILGAAAVPISSFTLKATDTSTNYVEQVTVQGYLDEQEGVAGFLPGGDADNGTETRLRDIVPTVWLYDIGGKLLAGPAGVGFDGKAVFSNVHFAVAPGAGAGLVVRGDIRLAADLENNPDRVAFDIEDAAADVIVKNAAGIRLTTVGIHPNGGTAPPFSVTVKKTGTAALVWSGNGGNVVAGREVLLGTLSIDTKDDTFSLRTFSVRLGSDAPAVSSVRIDSAAAPGSLSARAEFFGRVATLTGFSLALPKDKKTEVSVYGTLRSKDAGAVYAESVAVSLASTAAFQMVSSAGTVIDETKLGSAAFPISSNTASSWEVHFSKLTVAKTTDSPTQAYRGVGADVLRFTMKAEPEGAVRVKKITFKVKPGDAGIAGTGNDSLERWADLNGDFNDDDLVSDLALVCGSTRTVIGEGSSARLRYGVVKNGVKDATPQGIESAAGDYALIEYEFEDGNEYLIGAGGTQTFVFGLDTSQFVPGSYGLVVDILADSNFIWTDIPSGAYPQLSGTQASGLPVTTSISMQ
ncbi:hypothetical protein HY633_00095 [Candidatus Uhrbacteria bacterium]|nr:hypothetical protein [Candidatus Uhrbacteria bacterium]